jgi:hypothetical protein
MESREFVGRYARSPWGIASFFVALGSGAAASALGASAATIVVVAAFVLAGALALGLATGLGQRAATAEGEREARGRAAERMARAKDGCARLAAMRLPEGEVARARDLVVLEAHRLEESFARLGAYDPEAAQAVSEALDLVDGWLKERDESATERRYGLPDANPFPLADQRTAEALKRKAAAIAKGRADASGEIPPADRAAIEEELR